MGTVRSISAALLALVLAAPAAAGPLALERAGRVLVTASEDTFVFIRHESTAAA
jgi:hypothetical protein